MGSVEGRLQEEGVVTLVGMDRDVDRFKSRFFQFEHQGGLLLRIETEIGIDREASRMLSV